jgi:predicted glycosyltransferase
VQHNVNCRLARAVVVPDAIPPARLERYGARGKLRPYEGLKEEYYLADFEPDAAVLAELGLDPARAIVVVRTPPEVSLYHRFENDLFARVLRRLADAAAEQGTQAVVLPRVASQREELRRVAGFVVPEHAIDAQSLIAHADLVISAGGTMNREAVALGTPVYTTFQGRLGAVDERLIAEGRLRMLTEPEELDLNRRGPSEGADERASASSRVRRDPRVLVELLLSPVSD